MDARFAGIVADAVLRGGVPASSVRRVVMPSACRGFGAGRAAGTRPADLVPHHGFWGRTPPGFAPMRLPPGGPVANAGPPIVESLIEGAVAALSRGGRARTGGSRGVRFAPVA
ncbi:hypothetical protein MB84_29150 (plasmid) [Pandoraea oxalativorans]|uniref:Uncharacterized protein n=1 Tax=Pandoraea oxalativorans TaxID=573737 RepID=A0A0G3IE63_9BURK|nr:hypothetical protein MB84_29150 [Pandoraea oxalativorans]